MKKLLLLSLTAMSMSAWCETYTPPCTMSITSQEVFDQWTPEDANNDGGDNQWKYGDGYALYKENMKKAADDWLFSPAVTLTAGAAYEITGSIRNATTYSSDKQKFEFYVCEAPNSAAAKTQIYQNTGLAKLSYYSDFTGKYSAQADGEYYIAVHLSSAAYQGNCEFKGFEIKEVKAMPGAVTDLTVTPGAEGAKSATLSWLWATTNDLGGPAVAVTGANIYRGTSSYTSATATYFVGTMEVDNAEGGTTAEWTDNSIPNAGTYYYVVVPFNADGPSTVVPMRVQSPWVGPDTPSAVTNVVATPVEGNDKAVSITFDLPVAANGGYLDLNAVSYKITRTAGSDAAVTVADNWHGELPYVDDTLPGLNSYFYTVYTVYNGSSSFSGVKSNAVTTGGAMTLPYSNTFANKTDFDLFTVVNNGNGANNWQISTSSKAMWHWGKGSAVDAWAITPLFEMEAGKAYEISFTERVSKSGMSRQLSLYLGDATETEAMTTQLYENTVTSTFATTKSVIFGVPGDGTYCFGFRVTGEITDYNDFYVGSLSIKEIIVTPSAVSEFTATPAAEGALSVDLKWINPSTTNAGAELGDLSAVEVRRGSELIATIEEAEAGQEMTYVDSDITEPGIYTYSVIAVLGEQSSPAVSATTAWVGVDTPKAPENVNVVLDEDGSRTITWDAVTEGVNGGYVDAEAVRYEVTRNDDALADDIAETTYTDTEADLPLASYTYYVKAVAGELSSATAASPSVVFGGALSLPYNPDFDSADDFALWTMVNPVNENKNWKYSTSDKGLSAGFTNAGAWAITPPFKAVEGTCSVTYKATCYSARYTEDLEVYLLNSTDDLDNATKLADYKASSPSFPSAETTEFSITKDGTYHIGFKVVTDNQWTCTLKQCDIAQLTQTGVTDITADGTGFGFADGMLMVPGKGVLTIYSAQGAVVAVSEANGSVNLSGLAAGVYVARFVADDGNASTFKFVK